jgi:hypothetical protein
MKENDVEHRTEVIKASAAIHIQNNITLLQRRAWTFLLAHAYDDLPTKERHRIRVSDLMQGLSYESRNIAHIKQALRDLASSTVEWNVLDKDQEEEWGVTTLLAEATIKADVCTYAYGPTLRERLHNPRMYARISLSLQNTFDSKHALALWELCLDYLDEAKNYGESPRIPLETYRHLMGVEPGQYQQFKKLNEWVIKPSVAELNSKTDFHVTVDYTRERRKIVAVKFRMRRVLKITQPVPTQPGLFPESDVPSLVQALQEAGLSEHDAAQIWEEQFAYVDDDKRPQGIDFTTYVHEKIHLLRKQPPGKVKNTTGFLIQAIRQNWANPDFPRSKSENAMSTATKAGNRMQSRSGRKAADMVRLRDEGLEAQIAETCRTLAEEDPGLLARLLDELLDESPFHRELYNPDKTPLDNYSMSPILAALVDNKLLGACPDRFAELSLQ